MKSVVRAFILSTIFLLPILGNTPVSAATSSKEELQKKAKTSAKTKKAKGSKHAAKTAASAPSGSRFSALVVDADTGYILYEKSAGEERYPASLTKMMTLYLTFDALKSGKLNIEDTLRVSEKATSQPQTNIALSEGERLPVRTAIESIVVRSANDSAMALAETLGGTQWNFALMMSKKARELGMKDTVFKNPNGLPDNSQHTTAYDMAKLGIALRRDFPQYYHYFKLNEFSYNGVTYEGHNRVMGRYDGVDGIKTGYIRASGFNLVTSVKKDGYNLVAVIMGGNTAASRDNSMINMLDQTFAKLESKPKTYADNTSPAKKAAGGLSIVTQAHAN